MSIGFTERELDIMAVLWERGPSTVAEIRAVLPGAPAHTTVQTFLKILEEKGHVGHTEEGRAHRFFARVRREDAGRGALRRVAQAIFGGSAAALVSNLVADRRLSRSELEALRAELDERIAALETGEADARPPAAGKRAARKGGPRR